MTTEINIINIYDDDHIMNDFGNKSKEINIINLEYKNNICLDPLHNPPKHMIYPPGKIKHKCPSCKQEKIFNTNQFVW